MKTELEELIEQMISRGILFDEAVKEFEKKFILSTLKRYNNNLSKAASALGIHRNTLSKRLLDYQKGTPSNGHLANKDRHKNVHKTSQKRRPSTSRGRAHS